MSIDNGKAPNAASTFRGLTIGARAQPGEVRQSVLGSLWMKAPDDTVPEGFDEVYVEVTAHSHQITQMTAIRYCATADETERYSADLVQKMKDVHGPSETHQHLACVRYAAETDQGQQILVSRYQRSRIVALRLSVKRGNGMDRRDIVNGFEPPWSPVH